MRSGLARFRRAALGLTALAAVGAAQPALAWDDLGHRVVADLAYERLTPAAKAQVDALLAEAPVSGEPSCPVVSFADAAAFPDCVEGIRKYNDMRKLHFQAVAFCPGERPPDPCKNGECAGEAVKRAVDVLGDRAAPPAARLLALEQASHFLADLHQPTNMIDNRDDRGGEIRIILPGSSEKHLNLHDFWNATILSVALGGEEIGVRFVEPVAKAGGARWAEGSIDSWAAETQALARTLYARLPEPPACNRNPRMPKGLDRGYVLGAVPVAREQLAKAAVRLATVLNATLR